MKKLSTLIFGLLALCCTLSAQERVQTLIQKLNDAKSKQVLVVSHRGDWRNAPENSLQAFRNCIEMGVDMIEID